jgi:hypothetical protein
MCKKQIFKALPVVRVVDRELVLLHDILLCLTYFFTIGKYKCNKTIWMFYGKFADEGDNPVDK